MNKIAQTILETIGNTLWGFKPNLMKHIVDQHGAGSSLAWFVRNMPKYENTLKEWGPIRTHLIATQISVLNGCPYCTYGHAYALQLHYFKHTKGLLPVDEHGMVNWHRMDESEIIKRFREVVESSDLKSDLPFFDRLLTLRHEQDKATSDDDKKIVHLIEMFQFLNQCGINGNTPSDQAHDPINKETELRQEYSRLRSQNT